MTKQEKKILTYKIVDLWLNNRNDESYIMGWNDALRKIIDTIIEIQEEVGK